MMGLSMLLLCLIQAAAGIPAPDAPEAPGVYFRQDDSGWIRLQPAVTADAGASGIDLFIYTGGYTDVVMNIACPGPQASLRISAPQPTLFVRGIGSAKEAILVRLTKKKDRRAIRTSFSNVDVRNRAGFRKKDVFSLVAREYPDGSFSVWPEKNLPPGEYLLVLGNGLPAFDFGIDRGNK